MIAYSAVDGSAPADPTWRTLFPRAEIRVLPAGDPLKPPGVQALSGLVDELLR